MMFDVAWWQFMPQLTHLANKRQHRPNLVVCTDNFYILNELRSTSHSFRTTRYYFAHCMEIAWQPRLE